MTLDEFMRAIRDLSTGRSCPGAVDAFVMAYLATSAGPDVLAKAICAATRVYGPKEGK